MNEKLSLGARVAVGLVEGLWKYYIRPIPSDMMDWAVGRLIQFDVPSQESIDEHIAEVSKL